MSETRNEGYRYDEKKVREGVRQEGIWQEGVWWERAEK